MFLTILKTSRRVSCASVLLFLLIAGELSTASGASPAPLRRPISNEKPLLVFAVTPYYHDATIEQVCSYIPDDLRPFACVNLAMGGMDKPFASQQEWLSKGMDYCQANGFDFIVQDNTWHDSHDEKRVVTKDLKESYCKKYSHLIGFTSCELSGSWSNALAQQILIDDCDLAYRYGVHVKLNDFPAGDDDPIHSVLTEAVWADRIASLKDRFIVCNKGVAYSEKCRNECYDAFLKGQVENWGTNSETWQWWWDKRSTYVSKPNDKVTRDADEFCRDLAAPENLPAQNTLEAMSLGCTVYSFEFQQHMLNYTSNGRHPDAFRRTLYPLYQKAISGWIPSRAELMKKVAGSGSSYTAKTANRWYVNNPDLSSGVTADFALPLELDFFQTLTGQLPQHTLAMVKEQREGLEILVGNYRIGNKEHTIWGKGWPGTWEAWMDQNVNVENPANDYRTSVFVLKGVRGGQPTLTKESGDNGYKVRSKWHADAKEFSVFVTHNGPVRFTVEASPPAGR